MRRSVPLLALLVLSPTLVHAQPGPFEWQHTGFGGGGHLCRVAFDPVNAGRILVGSDVTGLFRSTDDGASWRASTDGLSDYYVRDIAIHPDDPQQVFVATQSGVSRSVDGGATWETSLELVLTQNPGKYAAAFGSVTVDPVDSEVIWASVGGFRFSSTAGPGGDAVGEHAHLWFSDDSGAPGSWTGIPSLADTAGVHTILPLDHDVDPTHPGTERFLISGTAGVYRYDYLSPTGDWMVTDLSGTLPHRDIRDLEAKWNATGQVSRLYIVLDSHWDGIDPATIYDHEVNPSSVYGGGVWYSDDLGQNWLPTSVSGDSLNLADGTGGDAADPDGPKNIRHIAIDQSNGAVYLALTERAMRNEGVWRADPAAGWNWKRITETRTYLGSVNVNVELGYYTSLGGVDGLEVGPDSDVIFTTNMQAFRCPNGACDPDNLSAPVWEALHFEVEDSDPETYRTTGMDVTQTFHLDVVPWNRSVWILGIGDHPLTRSGDGGRSWRTVGDRSGPPYDGYVGTNGRAHYFTSDQPGSEVLGVFGSWKWPPVFELWSGNGIPDDATVWTHLDLDPGQSIFVRDVLVLDPAHLLVATDTGIYAGDKTTGSWVFAADNAGVPVGKSLQARALAVQPGQGISRRILAAMVGDSSVPGGIYYREGWTDTWHEAAYLTGTPAYGMSNVESLTWSVTDPDRVYAGNSTTRFSGTIAGILDSTDRGETWALAAQALAGADASCFDVTGLAALAFPPSVGTGERVYAALKPKVWPPCQARTFGGVVFSDDPALATWHERREGLDAGHHTFLQADPTNPWRLFTGTLGNGALSLVENFSAATNPAEATALTVAKGTGTVVAFGYSPAGCAADHVVYWATISGSMSGPPAWTDQACFLGAEGSASFDPGDPAPGDLTHFVVVGNNGAIEGSYGRNSDNVERPEAESLGSCDYVRLLTDTCI